MEEKSSAISGLELQRESTAEQVAGALREAIIEGRFEAGTYLREEPLSKSLGVSRNTVREATQILVREGLVTREMHRGAFVTRLSAAEVRDIYRVRRIVELSAIQAAVDGDRGDLRAAVAALTEAVAAGDRHAIIASDLRFHRELVRLMQSERLGELFESGEAELRLCLALVGPAYADPGVALAEHQAILAALDAGDAEGANALLARHLEDAEQRLVDLVEEREASEAPAQGGD